MKHKFNPVELRPVVYYGTNDSAHQIGERPRKLEIHLVIDTSLYIGIGAIQ